VEIEDRIPVEADLVGGADEKLDRVFVVEDHLRFEMRPSLRFLVEFDEALGVEKGVGVAFEAARIPGEVDEEPVQNLLGLGAGRLFSDLRAPDGGEVRPVAFGEIGAGVRAVCVEEGAVVAEGLARHRGCRT
jgi:hypothetical protein